LGRHHRILLLELKNDEKKAQILISDKVFRDHRAKFVTALDEDA